jgi:hypothetical protein
MKEFVAVVLGLLMGSTIVLISISIGYLIASH